VTEKHYAHSHPHTSPLALADFKPSKIVPIAGRSWLDRNGANDLYLAQESVAERRQLPICDARLGVRPMGRADDAGHPPGCGRWGWTARPERHPRAKMVVVETPSEGKPECVGVFV